MPVSNSTTPSPALTAHALQWGTPGQGSGRRRRYTPGSTRSPLPSSRLAVALRPGDALPRSLAWATRGRLDYDSRAASKGEVHDRRGAWRDRGGEGAGGGGERAAGGQTQTPHHGRPRGVGRPALLRGPRRA